MWLEKRDYTKSDWKDLFYMIAGAFIFAGLFDSVGFCSSFENRFFTFFLVMAVGWAIANVVQEKNQKEADEKKAEEISKKYFGDNK